MSEVNYKEGDQIIVDNFLEKSTNVKLIKSQVCTVLVAGKFDLIVQTNENTYYPRVLSVSKKVCRRIQKRHTLTQFETVTPQINDLVAGIVTDISNKKKEVHVGVLEEIIHNNTSSKAAVIRSGNQRINIPFGNLVILEENKGG